MIKHNSIFLMLPVAVLVAGCATKGYVNSRIQEATATTGSRIDNLDRETAVLKNSTEDALRRAESASNSATDARDLALGKAGLREVNSHTVYFAFDSDKLEDEGLVTLDQATREIQNQPEVIVDIYGFTDETGPDRYNFDLGQRRAMEVLRYLVERAPGQLSKYAAVSYGEKSLAGKEATSSENATSRRVVVSLIKRIPLSESPTAELTDSGS